MNEAIQLLPPQHMVYIALAIGGVIKVLKTDVMSNWLNKLPTTWINAIPKWALPWLALFLSMVVSVVDLKLTIPSSTWKDAIAVTVQGVFSGSLAIAGHETLAKTVGKFIKLPPVPPASVFIFIIGAAVVTGVSGMACAPVVSALPHIIAAVVDAGQIIDTIVTFVGKWFAAHPDPEAQAKVDAAVVKVRGALNVLLRVANGVEDASNEKVDAAFEQFKQAYLELLALVRPYGVVPNASELSPKMTVEHGTLSVPTPMAFDPRVKK